MSVDPDPKAASTLLEVAAAFVEGLAAPGFDLPGTAPGVLSCVLAAMGLARDAVRLLANLGSAVTAVSAALNRLRQATLDLFKTQLTR